MPATFTHALFADDIYDELPIGLKKLLIDDKASLRMFAQSTDPFIFYKLGNKKGKKIREFQSHFHKNKSQEFFLNLINYIKYNNYYQNKEIMAFLYGFISHYVLDSTVHPYVHYKCGYVKKDDPSTYKYKNQHEYMENFLDNYLIKQRKNIDPYKYKFYDYCFMLKPFSKELVEVIDYAFKETFNFNNFSTYYYKALKDMYFYLKYFRYDRYGIKMFIYKSVDRFTKPNMFRLEAISYHRPLKDVNNYLNLNHQEWCHPCLKREKHKESFIELYAMALKEAMRIIRDVNNYLKGTKKVDLKKDFKNLSYSTGKNCDNKNELKYFEY